MLTVLSPGGIFDILVSLDTLGVSVGLGGSTEATLSLEGVVGAIPAVRLSDELVKPKAVAAPRRSLRRGTNESDSSP